MIKPIDEIPVNEKKGTYREKVRADIQEAISRDINMFEFVGDYNFKTLAGTAREEARRIACMIVANWSKDHPEYKIRYKNWEPTGWDIEYVLQLIKIYSIKGETPGNGESFVKSSLIWNQSSGFTRKDTAKNTRKDKSKNRKENG